MRAVKRNVPSLIMNIYQFRDLLKETTSGPELSLHGEGASPDMPTSVVKDTPVPPRDDSAHVVHRAGGSTEVDPREGSLLQESIPPVVGSPTTHVDQMPNLLPAENSISTAALSPSVFLRPALLDTLIKRLQTKRVHLHGSRVAGKSSEGRDTPSTRYRLRDLDSSQIYEYLKSGGRSINAPSPPGIQRVSTPLPSSGKVAQALSILDASNVARSPLLVATLRRKKSTPSLLSDQIAQLIDPVRFGIYCRRADAD